MFNLYPKNVPNGERILRMAIGAVLIVVAFSVDAMFGIPSALWVGFLLFNAAFVIVTGFYGWCPACAFAGRKIKVRHQPERK